MRLGSRPLPWLLLGTLVALAAPAAAVTLGQVDDFEDGTTQGWLTGLLGAPHPAPPQNVPGNGPAGTDDNHLLLTSLGGNGPGSRLAAINNSQWAGDYPSAGVGAIAMDVNNLSASDLYLRLLFEDPGVGPPTNVAITSAAVVPAGSGWTTVLFPVAPTDLIALQGSAVAALSNATVVRIFHNIPATYPPDPVVAQLGVDNIQALSDPTPDEDVTWGLIKNVYR